MKRLGVFCAFAALAIGCGNGGGGGTAQAPSGSKHKCGEKEKVHAYDLHDTDGQDHFIPCAETGKEDFSGNVHFDTTPEGIMVTIDAHDDDFNDGKHGSDLKGRDAVIVYPKGTGTVGVEVPLTRTKNGYTGKKLIPFSDLPKLTDEGSKIEIAIHDNDDAHKDGAHEQLKVSIAISAGKSCEKAIDENPQSITMGGKQSKDLTADQLGAPMRDSAFMTPCALPDSSNAEICAAVKSGKPLGVSVKVSPANNKIAACIDRRVRALAFPKSDKLDVVKQTF